MRWGVRRHVHLPSKSSSPLTQPSGTATCLEAPQHFVLLLVRVMAQNGPATGPLGLSFFICNVGVLSQLLDSPLLKSKMHFITLS